MKKTALLAALILFLKAMLDICWAQENPQEEKSKPFALTLREGAGSLATGTSMAALWTATRTFTTLGGVMDTSLATLGNLGKPLWNYARGKTRGQEAGEAQAIPAMPGYEPAQGKRDCAACGAQNLVTGNFPGLVIYCTGCGKPLQAEKSATEASADDASA